jgi:hypothetical protein
MIQISSNLVLALHANGTIHVVDGQDTKSLRLAYKLETRIDDIKSFLVTKKSDYHKQVYELAIWAESGLHFATLDKTPSNASNQFRLKLNQEETP